jgi:hypothetical protein
MTDITLLAAALNRRDYLRLQQTRTGSIRRTDGGLDMLDTPRRPLEQRSRNEFAPPVRPPRGQVAMTKLRELDLVSAAGLGEVYALTAAGDTVLDAWIAANPEPVVTVTRKVPPQSPLERT